MAGSMDEFRIYLSKFEARVIVAGIDGGRWGTPTNVTIRPGKLAQSPIATLVGTRFFYPRPAAIEYYGLVKKSLGFMELAAKVHEFGIGTIRAPLVNFSSVKIEDVAALAPDLVDGFVPFKKRIKEIRWNDVSTSSP